MWKKMHMDDDMCEQKVLISRTDPLQTYNVDALVTTVCNDRKIVWSMVCIKFLIKFIVRPLRLPSKPLGQLQYYNNI